MKEKALKTEKYISYVMLAIMLAGSLALIALGLFNHPTGDDYFYGVEAHRAFLETRNPLMLIKEAIEGAGFEYFYWQGTYSAMFFMFLPPNVASEKLYKLVTLCVITIFTLCIFSFVKILLEYLCGQEGEELKTHTRLIASAYVFFALQSCDFLGESIFWYNGSMYYTCYYSLTLLFLGYIIAYIRDKERQSRRGWFVFLLLFAFFLAGGNYVSLLPCMIIMCLLSAYLLYKRSNCGKSVTIITIVMLTGFAISAIAPGNRIREAALFERSGFGSVAKSLLQGLSYLMGWTGIWWFIFLLVITPAFINILENIKSDFKFKYPIIFAMFAYGLFCSMGTPTFYAMNSSGPARVCAIVYYGFFLTTAMIYFYVLGWAYRKQKKGIYIAIAAAIMLIVISRFNIKYPNMISAIRSIASGEAAMYEEEYLERYKILTDESVRNAVLPAYKVTPDMLYVGDFQAETDTENNIKIAKYFGKDSVRVDYGY